MGIFPSQRAPVDIERPEAWAICDRCGFRYLHRDLVWQVDWRGNNLQNLMLLVCERCDDIPQDQLRPIIIGPDPVPVKDPRPGWYASQMGFTPSFSVTEIIDGAVVPAPSSGPWLTDGNGNVITDGNGNPIPIGGVP